MLEKAIDKCQTRRAFQLRSAIAHTDHTQTIANDTGAKGAMPALALMYGGELPSLWVIALHGASPWEVQPQSSQPTHFHLAAALRSAASRPRAAEKFSRTSRNVASTGRPKSAKLLDAAGEKKMKTATASARSAKDKAMMMWPPVPRGQQSHLASAWSVLPQSSQPKYVHVAAACKSFSNDLANELPGSRTSSATNAMATAKGARSPATLGYRKAKTTTARARSAQDKAIMMWPPMPRAQQSHLASAWSV
eukprot:CAMPEP_0183524494 /NCGR_PEP_ID=MMETSP0371-20130417/19938_1 /TAXON_ID=268820 /ORGANISM="Peridinium aciculiferum, Strain PAER-2" /LENGTH=249 /DNA_ID=CAMNT_0025723603 /DNA_START=59 /DNA_END=804 /DNA_ORIENTATION=+